MGFPVYRCPSDLPERLPDFLRARNEFGDVTVELDSIVEEPGAYGFVIRRHKSEIRVYGGLDADGVHAFIIGGSPNPLRWRDDRRLFDDTLPALFDYGIRELTPDEIRRLDEESKDPAKTDPNKD